MKIADIDQLLESTADLADGDPFHHYPVMELDAFLDFLNN